MFYGVGDSDGLILCCLLREYHANDSELNDAFL